MAVVFWGEGESQKAMNLCCMLHDVFRVDDNYMFWFIQCIYTSAGYLEQTVAAVMLM